jgi:hypothetical protein
MRFFLLEQQVCQNIIIFVHKLLIDDEHNFK